MKIAMTVLSLAVSILSLNSAYAALGDGADSIGKDKAALSLSTRSTGSENLYRYEDLASDKTKGIVVRQFVSKSGQVFAFAWKGRLGTDLQPLLGKYAADFNKHETEHPPRKGAIPYRKVTAGNVVVEIWDTLHFATGRAYATDIMPQNIDLEKIGIK